MGGRCCSQAEQRSWQVPIGGMAHPGAGTASLGLSKGEPGTGSERQTDKDMLREDPPGEREQHPGELVDGPQTDQFGIVQSLGNDVPVRHGSAALLFAGRAIR